LSIFKWKNAYRPVALSLIMLSVLQNYHAVCNTDSLRVGRGKLPTLSEKCSNIFFFHI